MAGESDVSGMDDSGMIKEQEQRFILSYRGVTDHMLHQGCLIFSAERHLRTSQHWVRYYAVYAISSDPSPYGVA